MSFNIRRIKNTDKESEYIKLFNDHQNMVREEYLRIARRMIPNAVDIKIIDNNNSRIVSTTILNTMVIAIIYMHIHIHKINCSNLEQ